MQFTGALTALITPFRNGSIDEEAYRNLIEWQIEQGINGLVPCGTTGESATLSHEEHKKNISICIEQTRKRVPILAGAGSNNTQEAIALTEFAKKAGADGALHITPYYNKPTQEGLFQHYKHIAQAVDLPIIMYNVPGRTGVNMLPATVARLSKESANIIGIKEATGDLCQVSDIIEHSIPGFQLLTGDDFTVLPTIAVGGCGVISVSSNVAPKLMADLCHAALTHDFKKAKELHYTLASLNRAMFIEGNPIPVKAALALMGKCQLEYRLPLVPMQQHNMEALTTILKEHALIK